VVPLFLDTPISQYSKRALHIPGGAGFLPSTLRQGSYTSKANGGSVRFVHEKKHDAFQNSASSGGKMAFSGEKSSIYQGKQLLAFSWNSKPHSKNYPSTPPLKSASKPYSEGILAENY